MRGRTVPISFKVSPAEYELWNNELRTLKSNPSGPPPSMSAFIRDRVNESFEPIDVIAGRKLIRWFVKKVSDEEKDDLSHDSSQKDMT